MTFAMIQFLGLYLLAASMQPHRGVLLGGWRSIATPRATVIAGWSLVALSLGLAVAGYQANDIVTWFGLLPLACGAILLGLSFAPHLVRAFVVAGLAGGLVAMFL
jgi:flagellar biosynthesis protein FliQ